MNNLEKQIGSHSHIELIYKISFNGREIQQNQYVADSYVYIENIDKKILFLSQREKQYLIDTKAKMLKEIDLSAQIIQVKQLRSMIGRIEIKVLNDIIDGNSDIKHLQLSNSPCNPITFNAKIDISLFEGLEKTVYQKFNLFQKEMQLYQMELKPNEIINYSESVLTINGIEQKSIVELINITSKSGRVVEIDSYL